MKVLTCNILFVPFIFFCLIMVSCGGFKQDRMDNLCSARTLPLHEASCFSVSVTDFGYLAIVYVEKGDEMDSIVYALTRSDSFLLPEYARRVRIPVSRVATNSGTTFEFFRLLGVSDSIVATCGAKYLYSEEMRRRVEEGSVISLGSSFDINAENLLAAHPDVLFLSDLRDSPSVEVCPCIYNLEWKEPSGLGRTEWIKFFSLFFDRFELADSIYDSIAGRYMKLKAQVDSVPNRPTLFAAGCFGDTWYMTGGKGYMATMYRDAGADFLLSNTLVSTVTCGTEWLLANYSEADFWMNCGTPRLSDIDERLHSMKSYRSGEVFHFEKRCNVTEGMNISDFYESAVARPDVVLADLVSVIHPELLPEYEPVYLGRCEAVNNERGSE